MNIIRLFWTVSNLKPIQVYYQFKYRIFGFKTVKKSTCAEVRDGVTISIKELDEDDEYISRFKPDDILQDRLELLNEAVSLESGKWSYEKKTHLWNFNLHYFEYGISLAVRYKETGIAEYYNKLIRLYSDWRQTCFDKQQGDAWHPYTISLRLRNLLIISEILLDKKQEFLNVISQDMYIQYRFLMQNQEKNLLGNHYFENLVTLYIFSLLFNEEKNTRRIERALSKEINEQILPDGMHFERSFMYHNLILEDLLRVYQICDENCKKSLIKTIRQMSDCIFSFEDGRRLPAFNDAGSNVSKGKMQLLNAVKKITGYKPQYTDHLDNAGYYRLQKDKYSLMVDIGEMAPKYISGHGHCDALSFELYCEGIPIFVNSGTFQYQSKYRGYFRGTGAHNTICADGTEQSEIWGEHRTGRQSNVISSNIGKKKLSASLRDYKGNILSRTIEVDDEVHIFDSSSTVYTSYWHIHPDNVTEIISDRDIKINNLNGQSLHLVADDGIFEKIVDNNIYSEEFGAIQNIEVFKSRAHKIRIYTEYERD